MARKRKKRGWPVLFVALLLAAVLLWIFRSPIAGWLRPVEKPGPSIGRERFQEEIREEERKKLDEILRRR